VIDNVDNIQELFAAHNGDLTNFDSDDSKIYTNDMSQTKKQNSNHRLEDEFTQEIRNTVPKKIGKGLIRATGSWAFLAINLIFFAFWMLSERHYDLLTFWVSLEAIILSILILINVNQESLSDRRRSIKDYKIDLSVAQRVKRVEEELKELRKLLER
jgi:uncharacterized membrane protein